MPQGERWRVGRVETTEQGNPKPDCVDGDLDTLKLKAQGDPESQGRGSLAAREEGNRLHDRPQPPEWLLPGHET